MVVMSLRILCWAGLKHLHYSQLAGKYAFDYKKCAVETSEHQGGRTRLPKFKFSANFLIGLHVILQIQIKKIKNA